MAKGKKYNVLSPLKHDGEDFAVGDKVELDGEDDAIAAALIANGTIEDPAPAKPEPDAGK